jgi:uncharacterized protein (TIGR02217 family)
MIVADPLPIFPQCPTFGFQSQPDYLVKIVQREGGFERRDRKWMRPLLRFPTVPTGKQREADIEAATNFWHVVGGRASGFRFKDWADYSSTRFGLSPTPNDQIFTLVPDSPGKYQLTKRYQVGAIIQDRFIYRPDGASLRVANTLGVEQPNTTWTINEATGELSIGGGFTGTPGSWGGFFYCYVRFDSDFIVTLSDHRVQEVSFILQELRPQS